MRLEDDAVTLEDEAKPDPVGEVEFRALEDGTTVLMTGVCTAALTVTTVQNV